MTRDRPGERFPAVFGFVDLIRQLPEMLGVHQPRVGVAIGEEMRRGPLLLLRAR
jgi:hypothetical protein